MVKIIKKNEIWNAVHLHFVRDLPNVVQSFHGSISRSTYLSKISVVLTYENKVDISSIFDLYCN
jgi:hypothetical protein